jgi:hypothetical protein
LANALFQVAVDMLGVPESFSEQLEAANLPEVTEEEACVFCGGDSSEIEKLLANKPSLQPVEDFLGRFAF